jgi:membrane protein implicated in regulation of membrane protease activity
VLGPWGLARLADEATPRWYGPAVAGVLLCAAIAFGTRDDASAWLVAVLSALAVAGLTVVPLRWRPRLGWVVVATLVVELLVIGRPVAEILEPPPNEARSRAIAEALRDRAAYRIADFGWADDRPGPREGVRDLVGHRPALTDVRYLMVYRAAPRSAPLLAAMNVDVVGLRDAEPRRRSGLRAIEGAEPGLYRVRDPWPRAYWTADVRVVDDPEAALEHLRRPRRPAAVLEAAHLGAAERRVRALAEAGAIEPPQQHPAPVEARIVEQGPGHLVLDVDAPTGGLVVIAEGYDTGWQARVDGAPATVLRANLVLRAVPVEAGSHRLELEYRPSGVVALWVVWALTWLGLLGLVVVDRRARARRRTS